MYYGTEQGFTGDVNNNTQPLWTSKLNTTTEIYNFTQTINKHRSESSWW